MVEWLAKQGWQRDVRRLGMVSPDGAKFISEAELRKHEETFQHVYDASRYGAAGVNIDDLRAPRNSPSWPPPKKWSPYDKLKMRLGLQEADTFGLDYCHVFEGPNRTFLFMVKGNNAIILEDEPSIFPSDTLLAQFRLFVEANS